MEYINGMLFTIVTLIILGVSIPMLMVTVVTVIRNIGNTNGK